MKTFYDAVSVAIREVQGMKEKASNKEKLELLTKTIEKELNLKTKSTSTAKS